MSNSEFLLEVNMKEFFKKLGDMFLDQGGGLDEKRVLGVPILITAIIYVIITRDLTVAGFIAGLGSLLLGLGVAGDQGKLNVISTPPDSESGIPRS
jgi:hypothetical protein